MGTRIIGRKQSVPIVGQLSTLLSITWKALAIVGCLSGASFAQVLEPMPTRWLGPGEPPIPPPPQAQQRYVLEVESFSPRVPFSYEPGRPVTGRIAVVVASNIFSAVSNAVRTYTRDLASNGFSSITVAFSGSAEDLRGLLSNYYHSAESLKGAVLVGELPYARWEMLKTFSGSGITNQYCVDLADIFFMDLNGTWADTNSTSPFQAGVYDTRSGDLYLEVWVSRLRGQGITAASGAYTDEITILTNYFHRLHQYRITNIVMNKRGLTYTDSDWKDHRDSDQREMMSCYPTDVITRAVGVDAGAGGADFRDNYMTQNVEMIQLRCHGNSLGQTFVTDGVAITYATWTNKNPKAVFYNIYGCSGGYYLETNNIARIVIFNRNANGLVSWSHSGLGGMIGFGGYRTSVFFDTLGEGETVGEAFRRWYNGCVAEDYHYYEEYWMAPKWWNGMILNGDGALTIRTPRYIYVATHGGHVAPFGSWANAATSVHAAFDLAAPGDVVLIGDGRYFMTNTLTLGSSKTVTLRGTGETASAILDGSLSTNYGFEIKYGVAARLENLTLCNFRASDTSWGGAGSAGRMSGGTVRNCVFTNNHVMLWGAGGALHLQSACRVENSSFIGNSASNSGGGGLIVMNSGPVVYKCFFSNNVAGFGGAISLTSSGTVERCHIVNNRATGTPGGGGLYVVGDGAQIWHSVISGNVAHTYGGGLFMYRGWLCNSLVVGNTASNVGSGIFSWGFTNNARLGSFVHNCTIADNRGAGIGAGIYATQYTYVVNSIVWGNGTDDWHNAGGRDVVAEYSCFGEVVGGTSNLYADPLFVGNGDYRLQSGSPCINSATSLAWHASSFDLADQPRISGSAPDMGAYEFQGGASGDSDSDGMPDWWETLYGLNPNNPDDALWDTDGDGMNNLNEYIGDTNPTNSASFLHITGIEMSGCANISFPCTTGRLYSLQRIVCVTNAEWQYVEGQSNMPGHVSGSLTLSDTNDVPERFYRIGARVP